MKGATRDGEPLKDDAGAGRRSPTCTPRPRWPGCSGSSSWPRPTPAARPPTSEASEYKLFTTEYSRRLANASMDLAGPGGQLRVHTEEAPMAGRSESTYRYTVIDTIGGGSSEIQKNIIARRKLGLPKNF